MECCPFDVRESQWPNMEFKENGFPWMEWSYPQPSHNGVLLKSAAEQEGNANILLSNDNTLYPVRTEVTLLP